MVLWQSARGLPKRCFFRQKAPIYRFSLKRLNIHLTPGLPPESEPVALSLPKAVTKYRHRGQQVSEKTKSEPVEHKEVAVWTRESDYQSNVLKYIY